MLSNNKRHKRDLTTDEDYFVIVICLLGLLQCSVYIYINTFYFFSNKTISVAEHTCVNWTARSTGHWQPPMKIWKN